MHKSYNMYVYVCVCTWSKVRKAADPEQLSRIPDDCVMNLFQIATSSFSLIFIYSSVLECQLNQSETIR